MKHNSSGPTPSTSVQRPSRSTSPQTLEEVKLAQAKADLRVTLLIGDKKEVELEQQKVDLEKSRLELKLLQQKVEQGGGAD